MLQLLAGAGLALLTVAAADAQPAQQRDRERAQTRALNQEQLRQAQDGEMVYGSQLMTPQERQQYRDRMRSAATQEERDQIRREHHTDMQARAKERGMTLPDEPPMMPGGRGMGSGMGPGMGGGSGMCPGPMGPGMGKGMGGGAGRGPMAGPPQQQ
jgi:hypothetical protein